MTDQKTVETDDGPQFPRPTLDSGVELQALECILHELKKANRLMTEGNERGVRMEAFAAEHREIVMKMRADAEVMQAEWEKRCKFMDDTLRREGFLVPGQASSDN